MPSKPRIAFAIEFLEFVHAIQMECHASLKSICQAFELCNFKKITTSPVSKKMYPVIIDAFEEYRLYRLYRYKRPAVNSKDCHSFLAGNAIRSLNRYKALDETAIFGRGCRHEFPKKFLNLKHGERYAYAVWILIELEKGVAEKPSLKINILYDITCMLTKHLQSRDEDSLLDLFQFAIPIFHCYGHNGQCQVKFSPRRKQGFGLTDGEMLERLWSYIRGFAKMTKEMRPSHRIDVLSDALIHYGTKTVKKIGGVLVERLGKAIQIEKDAEEERKNLCDCINSPCIDIQAIRLWTNDEVSLFENEFQTEELSWSCKYLVYLDLYNNLYERWKACKDPHQLTVRYNQMKKIDNMLLNIEQDNSIDSRWTPEDQLYRNAKNEVAHNGQSLVARLAKQITRVTKLVKKDIETFNNEDHIPVQNLPSTITFESIKDPDGEFWLTLQPAYAEARASEIPFVPLTVKRKAIDLCHLLDRSREEQVMLRDEMENTWNHFSHEHELVSDFLVALGDNDDILDDEYGAELFARKKLLDIEYTLLTLNENLSPHVNVEMPQTYILKDRTLVVHDYNVEDDTTAKEEEERIVISGSIVLSDYDTSSDSECNSDGDYILTDEI